MNSPISIEEFATGIRSIYSSDVSQAETLIEKYLEENLKGFSPSERLELLDKLTHEFKRAISQKPDAPSPGPDLVAKLFSLFLGKKVSNVDLSSRDFLERLAGSLNTMFDSLNEIVGVINSTLLGKQAEIQTIRQIIGTNLHDELGGGSLENYLSQIKKAFLTSHQAFKQAAQAKISEILIELDPKRIADSETGVLKVGPLKKAGLFDVYQEKFQRVQKWFESERFMNDLLREFEKICRSLYR
ncbi:MAG: hypothetical protein P8X67_13105 [Syntrophobacterales bacterium]|jgi:hypothetical protein